MTTEFSHVRRGQRVFARIAEIRAANLAPAELITMAEAAADRLFKMIDRMAIIPTRWPGPSADPQASIDAALGTAAEADAARVEWAALAMLLPSSETSRILDSFLRPSGAGGPGGGNA